MLLIPRSEYRKIRTRKNSVFGNFLRSDILKPGFLTFLADIYYPYLREG